MARTVVATAYGGPEVLEVIDADIPPPGQGQVVVAMRAVGVNPLDYKLYSGAFGTDPARLPIRPGMEGAGIVEQTGAGADTVRVGDEVIVRTDEGAYADRVLLPVDDVLPKPESLTWEGAACLLSSGATAYEALAVADVGEGDTVVIHGAAGGVGELAVQLAVMRGAVAIGVAWPVHHDFLRTLGAVPVSPRPGLVARIHEVAPDGVDAVVDTVGTDEVVDDSLALGVERDRFVSLVAFGRAVRDGFRTVDGISEESARIRREARPLLVDMAGHGGLDVVVGTRFPLAEAAAAHRALQEPHARGKFVLLP
ncbi:zinc-binding dehydrogenase [Rhodococcus hoagii]|uniref:NADP-dependent oxidoreductase n=1 Tax=Rhodococcus hoagii TaxID=43767 RepID=UPI0007CD9031|nr:NADP-dependent oxidoreductase [Prescottella equi]MBM4534292.1 zinc-binding dehydrogenase [Prescottella equi]NKR83718.1 zinc-binding dehydrogenase [Prescottella equi]ORJ94382.1 alcohol dehydrogenase [Prescottella equi]ORL09246.1 alcohol dehydrogenase [Prescottella equi]ORL72488.1 alcohol dehydrogenase [Prescottella equi]